MYNEYNYWVDGCVNVNKQVIPLQKRPLKTRPLHTCPLQCINATCRNKTDPFLPVDLLLYFILSLATFCNIILWTATIFAPNLSTKRSREKKEKKKKNQLRVVKVDVAVGD